MTRRHTKRDLTRILKDRGIRANRLLGQSFLVDHNVLSFICAQGGSCEDDVVLEIGAGTGMLTWHLAASGAEVVAVEIDAGLYEIAMDYVGARANVHLVHSDIHGARRTVHPEVEAALTVQVDRGRTLKVISNLPYCISSDLLVSLFELPWPVERMVLTVQTEFADRLLAGPGSRDYGPLSVELRARADVRRLKTLAPEVFWPVPKVGSAVVRIDPNPERLSGIHDLRVFRSVVKALFSQRRKTAAGALTGLARPRLGKGAARAALAEAGVPDRARADGLSVDRIIALCNAIAQT